MKAAHLAEQTAQRAAERKCERPQVRCDVGLKKICSETFLQQRVGHRRGTPMEKYPRGTLRVPLPNDDVDY